MNLLYKVQTRFLFHAHIKIKISAFYEDTVFDELFAVLEEVDGKYNSYRPGSYFDLVNMHAGDFVEVDDVAVDILKQAIFLSETFDGTYDITIMPLIRLWGFYKESRQRIPSAGEIRDAQQLVDYRKIEIDGNRVRIADRQEIITGSFIKAYAVDRLVSKMKEIGIDDAIINAGGSTIMAVNNESHPVWQVMARHPESEEQLFKLNVSNRCYSTSSQTRTFVDIAGKRYGHILNPKTGFPSATKQVGIITHGCMPGDMISTALFNETSESFLQKIALLSQHFEVEGFIIDEDGKMTCTKGFQQYIN